ncbi:MAG: putative replicase [Cressdnaviricota sp.]|nr:MAG: putative replicase [Cressdnaviricota sp.]
MTFILTNPKKQNLQFCQSYDIASESLTLGITTNAPCIGYTISPPSNLLVKTEVKRQRADGKLMSKFLNIKYADLPPKKQINYLIQEYIPYTVTPFFQKGIITFELNKNGNIHSHLICQHEDIKDAWDLKTVRSQILNTVKVKKILKQRSHLHHVLNHIHYLKDVPDWITYMSKDTDLLKDKNIRLIKFC